MDDGVVTLGVSGEVALLAGVELDLSVSVDTKPAQAAAEAVYPFLVGRDWFRF